LNNNTLDGVTTLTKYAESRGHIHIVTEAITPGIEDSFIRLMNDSASEVATSV
jgi:hypothetical protein